VHYHVVAPDGVFTRETRDGPAFFHDRSAPSMLDVAAVAGRVEKRMLRWLRRHGLIDERAAQERSNQAPALSPRQACMQASLFAGEFARVQESEPRQEDDDAEARLSTKKKSPWSAEVGGFNVSFRGRREERPSRPDRSPQESCPSRPCSCCCTSVMSARRCRSSTISLRPSWRG
jgi:hypothetical protein